MGADLAVIGSGFGGLGAALGAQDFGKAVHLYEALNYPGGCASTFSHKNYRFEAGATLFSGFDERQPFGRWLRERKLDVTIDRIDPLVELRTPLGSLAVTRDRAEFADRLCVWVGERPSAIRAFLAYQKQVADVLWELFETPELLPPLGLGGVARHLWRSPRYLRLLALVGRSLDRVLARFDLLDCVGFRVYLDAVCQITVQTTASEAEAPFALAAMDYFWRGTGHVRGGIGTLATALLDSIQAQGGQVSLSDRVNRLEPLAQGWRIHSRSGSRDFPRVAANLLPQDLQTLVGGVQPQLETSARRVKAGWGACMLYRVVKPPLGLGDDAQHLQIVHEIERPFHSGNHLFVSISSAYDEGRCPAGLRTMTVSTHVPLSQWEAHAADERGHRIAAIQQTMRRHLALHAPEWEGHVVFETSASPRTFARFTRRSEGWVGGIPRTHGLGQYRDLWPALPMPRLALVGDSHFPGQSTLAAAIGGQRAVTRLLGK